MRSGRSHERLENFKGELDDRAAEVLRAEFDHVASSLISNEESGERRVNILLGVIAAVIAALGVAADQLDGFNLLGAGAGASFVLFLLGLVTWRRAIQRNVATTEYLNALRRIRARWAWNDSTLAPVLSFVPTETEEVRTRNGLWGIGKAGVLETVVATNSLIVGVGVTCTFLLWENTGAAGVALAGGCGLLAAIIAWASMMCSTKRLYEELAEDRANSRAKALEFWAEWAPQGEREGEL